MRFFARSGYNQLSSVFLVAVFRFPFWLENGNDVPELFRKPLFVMRLVCAGQRPPLHI
jgi:hypothetical protein